MPAALLVAVVATPVSAAASHQSLPAPTADAIAVSQANWDLDYSISSHDGVVITSADWMGRRVFFKVTVPYVKVTYTDPGDFAGYLYDELGTGNSTYQGDLAKSNITGGFQITASFRFGSWPNDGTYKYVQTYKFFSDGRFQVLMVVYGPGFGPSAHYDTLWRIDFDIEGSGSDTLEQWTGSWTLRTTEGRFTDTGSHAGSPYPSGSEWANNNHPGSTDTWTYFTIPYAPDTTYLYGLRYQGGEEGGTPGSETWPSVYADGQSINKADLVNWYDAHSYPCTPSAPCSPGPWPFAQNVY